MVVMSDTDDPFVPLPDDLLVNLAESRGVFEGLLDAIPATFAANSQVGRGTLFMAQKNALLAQFWRLVYGSRGLHPDATSAS